MLGKLLIGVVVVALLLGVGVAYLAYQAQKPSALIATLPTIVSTKEDEATLDQKLKDFDKEVAEARKTGVKKDVQLEVTQEELTSRATRMLTASKSGDAGVQGIFSEQNVKGVQVHVQDDSIIGSATVNVQGFDVPVAAQVKVDDSGEQPKFTIEKVDLGSLPLPQSVSAQVTAAIEGKTDISKMNLPVDLKNVKIENGKIVVQGQTR